MNNALKAIPESLKKAELRLDNLEKQLETAKEQAAVPFPREDEYKEKTARLSELAAELKMGKDEPEIIDAELDEQENGGSKGKVKKSPDRDSR